ncbi:DUF2752 domain-containing protein [Ferruginibacter sp.]|nr:DUF2752 domain-containing protein [Ferruginibacter sp.]
MSFYFINIINWLEQHQLPCLFKTAFHFDCPGCGFQRSGIALLNGDVWASLKLYPALLPMLLFFIFLILNNKFRFSQSVKFMKMGTASIFIIILASYLYKLTA